MIDDIPDHDSQLDAPLTRNRQWVDPDEEADQADAFNYDDEADQ